MTEDKPDPLKSLLPPRPTLDKSKWVQVEKPKPVEPHLVIEVARAIRANPELWAIFTSVKPDEWITEEDNGRIGRFHSGVL